MLKKHASILCCLALLMTLMTPAAFAKDPQLVPNRLSSTGDSITEAIDAELILANHWASWSNGYTNFWTWLFGYTNVNSHNQRITAEFGRSGRKNFMQAVSGQNSTHLDAQTQASVNNAATYVTMFMATTTSARTASPTCRRCPNSRPTCGPASTI